MEAVALRLPPTTLLYIVYPWYTVTDWLSLDSSLFFFCDCEILVFSYSDVLVCQIKEESEDSGSLLMNMNNGLVMMTGKSQSRTTTSRTISISLTLQAQPLSRMKKSDLLTERIPPAACSSKDSHDDHPLHLTAPLLSSHNLPWGKAHPTPHHGWSNASSTPLQPIHNT